ncbi:MAG: response regulator [Dehalococcoidia bacterium]|nr:response regulator [Dehalococcoidia bacterium]MYA60963.1 response regulator [Dehalococcoidia bacterium]
MTLGDSRPVQILLVEDNPADARLTQEAIRDTEFRYQLHLAEDGEEAMEFLYQEGEFADVPRPDLILLDLNLPGMDGREVLAEIKSDENLGSIPVVVLTTSTAQQDLLYSYGLRANSYVNKPIDRDRFNDMIKSVMEYWINISTLPGRQ